MTLLTPKQRSTLAQIAKEAYAHLAPGLSESADEFRHAESKKATAGLKGAPAGGWTIKEAPKTAFNALHDHFKTLKGDVGEVYDRQVSGRSDDLSNVLHEVTVAARTAGVNDRYVAGICRRMFGREQPKDLKQAQAILAALGKMIRKQGKEPLS